MLISLPGDTIVYAISDRDAYRKTLELCLRDTLTRTEQLLLWEERRLGISDDEHQRLLDLLVLQMNNKVVSLNSKIRKAGAKNV